MAAVADGPNGRTSQRSIRPTANSRALATMSGQVRFQMRRVDSRPTGSDTKGGSSIATHKLLHQPYRHRASGGVITRAVGTMTRTDRRPLGWGGLTLTAIPGFGQGH